MYKKMRTVSVRQLYEKAIFRNWRKLGYTSVRSSCVRSFARVRSYSSLLIRWLRRLLTLFVVQMKSIAAACACVFTWRNTITLMYIITQTHVHRHHIRTRYAHLYTSIAYIGRHIVYARSFVVRSFSILRFPSFIRVPTVRHVDAVFRVLRAFIVERGTTTGKSRSVRMSRLDECTSYNTC